MNNTDTNSILLETLSSSLTRFQEIKDELYLYYMQLVDGILRDEPMKENDIERIDYYDNDVFQRVAVYARVSTDSIQQTTSYEKQLQKRPIADGGFVFAPLKNDKVRTIVPAPYVMDLLKAWQQEQARNRLLCGSAWEGWKNEKERQTALVFTHAVGTHLHPQTTYNHFKKLAASVGASNARVHDLRHTYAVLSLQNGDDVKTV